MRGTPGTGLRSGGAHGSSPGADKCWQVCWKQEKILLQSAAEVPSGKANNPQNAQTGHCNELILRSLPNAAGIGSSLFPVKESS